MRKIFAAVLGLALMAVVLPAAAQSCALDNYLKSLDFSLVETGPITGGVVRGSSLPGVRHSAAGWTVMATNGDYNSPLRSRYIQTAASPSSGEANGAMTITQEYL